MIEEEKTRTCFTDGSASMQVPPRSTQLQHYSFGTTLKVTVEGKSSQWAELWAVHMVTQFISKKKWLEGQLDNCSLTRV